VPLHRQLDPEVQQAWIIMPPVLPKQHQKVNNPLNSSKQ
jgi:hypothetical protein